MIDVTKELVKIYFYGNIIQYIFSKIILKYNGKTNIPAFIYDMQVDGQQIGNDRQTGR